MPYLNTATGEYPRFDGDLELLGWQQGTPLPASWVSVEIDPYPEIFDGQTAETTDPQQDAAGTWRVTWTVRNLTEDELLEMRRNEIRSKVAAEIPLTADEAALLVG